jgi:polyhydroxyalkanoate synthesis regulator phasin
MANFNDRLTRLEKAVERIEQRLWEQDNEPLVPDDGGLVDLDDVSPEIKELKEQIAQLEIQRQNLLNDGENVIEFPQKT